MILEILLGVSVLTNIIMLVMIFRFGRKLLQYDEVIQFITDDIETNLRQFARMESSSVMNGEPEIQQAHKNMMVMSRRLDEILNRMEETSGLKLRPPPALPRPKVV